MLPCGKKKMCCLMVAKSLLLHCSETLLYLAILLAAAQWHSRNVLLSGCSKAHWPNGSEKKCHPVVAKRLDGLGHPTGCLAPQCLQKSLGLRGSNITLLHRGRERLMILAT